MENKQVIGVRMDLEYELNFRTWVQMGNIHNQLSIDFDENDILSFAIHQAYTSKEKLENIPRDLGGAKKIENMTIFPQVKQFVKANQFFNSSFVKTFRISTQINKELEELTKRLNEKNKSSIIKILIENILLDNHELTIFLIRNYIATMFSTISVSYLRGKITSLDLKNFILYNEGPKNKNTDFENFMVEELIKKLQSIYTFEILTESIKSARLEEWAKQAYSRSNEIVFNIKDREIAPYERRDILIPVISLQMMNETLAGLLEIYYVYLGNNGAFIMQPFLLFSALLRNATIDYQSMITGGRAQYSTFFKIYANEVNKLNKLKN
jgi:hypothetical protein